MDGAGRPDGVDWALLELLQGDARATWSELGRTVRLSAAAVADRVRRLEEAGVITGYRAVVDVARLGRPLRAVVRVDVPRARGHRDLDGLLQELPEVVRCQHLTGEDCHVLEVAVADVAHLERLIDRLGEHGDTTTSVVLSTLIDHRVHRRPDRVQAPRRV